MRIPNLTIFIGLALSFGATAELMSLPSSTAVKVADSSPNEDDRGDSAAAKFEEARALLPKGTRKGEPEKSFALMKEAAATGHADAIGALGHYHARGIGTPKNEVEAVAWFRKGAELGSPKAMLNFGLVLSQGKGIEVDQAAGREWIRKAAASGLPEANLEWAEAMFHGNHGVEIDKAGSFPFYKVAADAGITGAANTLGTLYEYGTGVEADAGIAKDYYRKAAKAGHTLGQLNYGRMLNPESPDPVQRVEAMAWLILAEEKGLVQAAKLLQPMRISGNVDLGRAQERAGTLRMEILRGRAGR